MFETLQKGLLSSRNLTFVACSEEFIRKSEMKGGGAKAKRPSTGSVKRKSENKPNWGPTSVRKSKWFIHFRSIPLSCRVMNWKPPYTSSTEAKRDLDDAAKEESEDDERLDGDSELDSDEEVVHRPPEKLEVSETLDPLLLTLLIGQVFFMQWNVDHYRLPVTKKILKRRRGRLRLRK